MMAAGSVRDFGQRAVEQVRAVTGFDRVALYRFAGDESGEVVAEAIRPDLAPWLACVTPPPIFRQQARALYLKKLAPLHSRRELRAGAAGARPAPLLPAGRPT